MVRAALVERSSQRVLTQVSRLHSARRRTTSLSLVSSTQVWRTAFPHVGGSLEVTRFWQCRGYADSLNQIPYNFTSLSTNGLIQDNNSLILHGIYVGAEYSW